MNKSWLAVNKPHNIFHVRRWVHDGKQQPVDQTTLVSCASVYGRVYDFIHSQLSW